MEQILAILRPFDNSVRNSLKITFRRGFRFLDEKQGDPSGENHVFGNVICIQSPQSQVLATVGVQEN
jgi:hypothetical protein